ncbi:MAG: hypothetical protein RR322_03690 [Oscillospiraceae bacterium]
MSVFSIDGISFNVSVEELNREAEIMDRYAERTVNDGVLHRSVLGTYFNYNLKINVNKLDNNTYYELYDICTAPQENHTITIPFNGGKMTYKAYISGVSDSLINISNNSYTWGDLQLKFIAMKPAILA